MPAAVSGPVAEAGPTKVIARFHPDGQDGAATPDFFT